MAKRDPYYVPRRGGDASGPLIRWMIILGLTAASAALAYHYISAEQGAPPAIEARETAPLPPQDQSQYAESASQSASDPTALDAASSGSEATAPAASGGADAQTAEPPLSEPASAPAPEPRPRPRRPPPPPPADEPTPPPTANFPVAPPVDNPTPPPPT
jgi:hypothetical protein